MIGGVELTYGWKDLGQEASHRGLTSAMGQPSLDHVDLFLWPPDDVEGWLDAATHVGAKILYVFEVTFADRVEQLSSEVEELRNFYDEGEEAQLDAIEARLATLVARQGSDVLGWAGDWRHEGVAHALEMVALPESLAAIDAEIKRRVDHRPTRADMRQRRSEERERQRKDEQEARSRHWEAAVEALASHPDFPACTNLAMRKVVLNRLGIDTIGLNKEEIIAEAKNRLTPLG